MARFTIFLLLLTTTFHFTSNGKELPIDSIGIEFLGMKPSIPAPGNLEQFKGSLLEKDIKDYILKMDSDRMKAIASSLGKLKNQQSLNDWLFYQLIRRTAENCISKKSDYIGYTLYKWYLLKETGYEPLISISTDKILLYVKSSDAIYNLPLKNYEDNQYVCLNYHDYGYNIELQKEHFVNLASIIKPGENFSFNIQEIPVIDKHAYQYRQLNFTYKQKEDHINVLVNPELRSYFKNYPVTDYQNQFNIPLSKETHQSLINSLKLKVKKLSVNDGVEYLMYFTRNAFAFEKDSEIFGREKRFSPEETLLYETSDCEDRSALFFYLVKEIYDLPMIVLSYEDHVTVAVKLDKEAKSKILYNNEAYTVCEATPQAKDLRIGMMAKGLEEKPFEISYAYTPVR